MAITQTGTVITPTTRTRVGSYQENVATLTGADAGADGSEAAVRSATAFVVIPPVLLVMVGAGNWISGRRAGRRAPRFNRPDPVPLSSLRGEPEPTADADGAGRPSAGGPGPGR